MKFRKKPVVIEAIKWTGKNDDEITSFCPYAYWAGKLPINAENGALFVRTIDTPTLEGRHVVSFGDWIIRGINGEFYPCKPDVFEKTYAPVDQHDPRDALIEQMGEALRGNKKALDDFCGQFACQDCPILPRDVQSPACPLSTIMADADKALDAYKEAQT